MSFMGTAFSEPTLIRLASGFEAAVNARRPPQFLPTLPLDTATARNNQMKVASKAAMRADLLRGRIEEAISLSRLKRPRWL
jgi:hypothetical protein